MSTETRSNYVDKIFISDLYHPISSPNVDEIP